MDVALDTSALSDLDGDKNLLKEFLARLRKDDLRLVLPYLTVIEALASTNPQAAKRRADLVLMLAAQQSGNFIIGGDLKAIIPIELARKGPRSKRTPRLRDEQAWRVFDVLTNARFVKYHNRVVDELAQFLKKSEHLDHDRRVRDHVERTFSKPSSGALDTDMQDVCMKALHDSPFVNHWTSSKRKQRHIRFNPAKRPCLTSWCAQTYLNAIGNFYAKFRFGRFSNILSGPKPNTWVDTAIAAAGSYAEFFVTNDALQARRLNFVARELGLSVKAVALSEFLDRTEA